jgi:hypothetical protein
MPWHRSAGIFGGLRGFSALFEMSLANRNPALGTGFVQRSWPASRPPRRWSRRRTRLPPGRDWRAPAALRPAGSEVIRFAQEGRMVGGQGVDHGGQRRAGAIRQRRAGSNPETCGSRPSAAAAAGAPRPIPPCPASGPGRTCREPVAGFARNPALPRLATPPDRPISGGFTFAILEQPVQVQNQPHAPVAHNGSAGDAGNAAEGFAQRLDDHFLLADEFVHQQAVTGALPPRPPPKPTRWVRSTAASRRNGGRAAAPAAGCLAPAPFRRAAARSRWFRRWAGTSPARRTEGTM